MNLVLLEASEADTNPVTLHGRRARHIIDVLGVLPGDTLRVGRLNGPLGQAVVESVGADHVRLRCTWQTAPPPKPRLHLLLAMPRPKVLQRLWSTLAQLGIARIYLTNAAKVERYYFDSRTLEPARIREGLGEGLEQAVDTWLPEVSVHLRLTHLLEDDLPPSDVPRLFADPPASETLETLVSRTQPAPDRPLLVAIGPEGGWNAHERDLFEAHGFHPFHVGPRILRTDTAVVAVVSRLQAALGSA